MYEVIISRRETFLPETAEQKSSDIFEFLSEKYGGHYIGPFGDFEHSDKEWTYIFDAFIYRFFFKSETAAIEFKLMFG
jgi:hypothetical protein